MDSASEALPGPPRDGLSLLQLIPSVIVPALVANIGRQLVTPVLPVFAKETLGLSHAAVGTLLSLEGFGGVVVNIPAGVMVGAFGSVSSSVVGTALQAIAAVLAATSGVPFQLFVSRFVSGTSLSVWNIARQYFISNTVRGKQRGKAMSLVGGSMRVAQVIGPLIGGLLADHMGIRTVFLAQAAVSGVTCILVLAFMARYDRLDTYGAARHSGDKGNASTAAEQEINAKPNRGGCLSVPCPGREVAAKCWRPLLAGGMYSMMLSSIRQSRNVLFPLVGLELGLSQTSIGGIQAAGAVVDSSLILVAGWISDKFGRKWSGIPSTALLSIAFVVLALSRSLPMLFAASLLAGFGNGFSSGIINLLGADTASEAGPMRGEYLGIFRMLADTGAMLGPLLAGCLASALSLQWASVAIGVISAFATVWLSVCYWYLQWIREPDDEDHEYQRVSNTGNLDEASAEEPLTAADVELSIVSTCDNDNPAGCPKVIPLLQHAPGRVAENRGS